MVFEGIWSKETHPKDFPTNVHFTHFSDVIGASHRRNFSFWGEGQTSSDGLMQLAEWGSARGMEAELMAQVFYKIKINHLLRFFAQLWVKSDEFKYLRHEIFGR